MKSIVIIGAYFGKFPSNMNLWLKSCENNETIDFKIFTDQKIKSPTKNIEFINMTLKEMNELVHKKIGKDYNILMPYKCNDFKVVYGIIFEDYIKKYDFWGHCDFDLIFGNIRKFITNDILNKYDKILGLGHLSIYRNTKEVKERYKDNGSLIGNYDYVYKNKNNLAFDEFQGIMSIYLKNNYPVYNERIFADISISKKRFTLACKDKNYKYQIFYWENGNVYRAYFENGEIKRDEFIYIHFKERKYLIDYTNLNNVNSFYICNKGFIQKKIGLPTLQEIKKYNNYEGFFIEIYEKFRHKIKNKIKNFKNKRKNKKRS